VTAGGVLPESNRSFADQLGDAAEKFRRLSQPYHPGGGAVEHPSAIIVDRRRRASPPAPHPQSPGVEPRLQNGRGSSFFGCLRNTTGSFATLAANH
jgi:hypothetical protein